ncbi:MAG: hypothetical protein ACLSIL_16300 [Enterococcus casseliflavus]
MVQFSSSNARFVTEEEAQIHLTQRGPLVIGNTSSDAFIGARSEVTLNTTSGVYWKYNDASLRRRTRCEDQRD